jgi:hypothetical protein
LSLFKDLWGSSPGARESEKEADESEDKEQEGQEKDERDGRLDAIDEDQARILQIKEQLSALQVRVIMALLRSYICMPS